MKNIIELSVSDIDTWGGGTGLHLRPQGDSYKREVTRERSGMVEYRHTFAITQQDWDQLVSAIQSSRIFICDKEMRPGRPGEALMKLTVKFEDGTDFVTELWSSDVSLFGFGGNSKSEYEACFCQLYESVTGVSRGNLNEEYSGPYQSDWVPAAD